MAANHHLGFVMSMFESPHEDWRVFGGTCIYHCTKLVGTNAVVSIIRKC